MRRAVVAMLSFASVGCDRPSKHVYSSPPPQRPLPAGATPALSTPLEIPFGTMGPGAQLVSVTDAATGVPVALGSITDSVDVLTLVAFGPDAALARVGGRVEFEVRGQAVDTTMVRQLGAPAPSVAANTFRLTGLKSGRYSTVVRLRMTGGHVLAESIPFQLQVVAP